MEGVRALLYLPFSLGHLSAGCFCKGGGGIKVMQNRCQAWYVGWPEVQPMCTVGEQAGLSLRSSKP